MECFDLFPTKIWIADCNLDTASLSKEILDYEKKKESVKLSNIGGYQAHDFKNEAFLDACFANIPQLPKNPIEGFTIWSWVNVNRKGDYNTRHHHYNTDLFLSGVYYVSVPKDSGVLRLWDPRGGLVNDSQDMIYFSNGHQYIDITPKENMMIFFPSWLEHDVTPNNSDEERISIAFNIKQESLQLP